MKGSVVNYSTELEELSTKLLATLDESTFFGILGEFLSKHVPCDNIIVNRVMEDNSVKIVSFDGRPVVGSEIKTDGPASAGYVIRTKRPYFSNNVERDPIFEEEANKGILAELCVPIIVDGIILGTVHFQSKTEGRDFGRNDITTVLSVLAEIKRPLVNIKMYLSARHLNEVLLKKIEEKENEIKEKMTQATVLSSYTVSDKKVISNSDSMKKLLDLTARAAKSDVAVLVSGETGVGKEMIAKKLHCLGERKNGPFISFDCSSISTNDFEEELFGREQDFSSKKPAEKGLLELANGGTIFLNNVELLPLNIQSRLNTFFDEGMAFKVGGHIPFRSNVRLIGATCIDLKEASLNGSFREDFYYTLVTIQLKVPALRERQEDIESLASLLLNSSRKIEDQKSLSPGVVKIFKTYPWPGNIRELKNVLERAYILSDLMIIEKDHLDESLLDHIEQKLDGPMTSSHLGSDEVSIASYLEMTLDQLERRHICSTLEHLGGNKTKTATE